MTPLMERGRADELREGIRSQLARARKKCAGEESLRAEMPAPGLDAASWLCAQPAGSRGFWSDREQAFALAGVGRADALMGDGPVEMGRLMQALHERTAQAGGNLRYFGGFCFDLDTGPDTVWQPFGRYRFILPRFEVVRRGATVVFACNARMEEDPGDVERELDAVRFTSCESNEPLPLFRRRTDLPDLPGWTRAVDHVLDRIRAGDLEKVVLARRATLELAHVVSPAHVLRALRAHTQSSFHFCFQPDAGHAFIGASPERLYRRTGTRFDTEAIAGTRVRGRTPEEDRRLLEELRRSEKDLREHRIVVDGIRAALRDLVEDLDVDETPRVLQLAHNQHLMTSFQGHLRSGVDDAMLLDALHPTPAVGGAPTNAAMEVIRGQETFSRGWYAAPLGWISRDAAQFAVGIRSALVAGDRIHLFSGAGIVAGSEANDEWNEIEHKLDDFLELFQNGDLSHGHPAA